MDFACSRQPASQAAEMVLPLGNAEGGPENRHRGADQWLYVLSGNGIATVKKSTGAKYMLMNGETCTLNFYCRLLTPATAEELPRGEG